MELTKSQQLFVDNVDIEYQQCKFGINPDICSKCEQCQSDYGLSEREIDNLLEIGELYDEGGFSWHDCELCGSNLGGDRYSAHGITNDENEDILHYNICANCVHYLANGDIPEHPYK